MAPQNKREASQAIDNEAQEESHKRLKDDVVQESGDTKKPSVKTTVESTITSSNNKVNKNNDENNESKSDTCTKPTNGSAKTDEPTNGSNDEKITDEAKDKVDSQVIEARVGERTTNDQQTEQISNDVPNDVETSKSNEPIENKTENKPTSEEADVKPKDDSKTCDNDDNEEDDEDESTGTLLLCGGANWDMTGRKELPKGSKKPTTNPAARNLWAPHRVRLTTSDGKPLRVKGMFSGCNACHSVIVTDDGQVMTFGRNDKGQLGLGDTETRITPVVVEKLDGIDIVSAACGRSHTLFLDSSGLVYATGDNKMGQCGIDKQNVPQITTPQRIVFKEAKRIVKMACGAEFSMILDEDGRLYSFGHPEHGQLGHGSEGKYFTSGNKYAFHCEYVPRRVVNYISKTREGHITPVDEVKIVEIACGTNHTLAVDTKQRCFSWGFAGYHRLGHSETKNELVPRSIKIFEAPNNSDRGATKVFAGSSHSMAIDVHGVLYFWGQNKSSGEATMYPKVVQDLSGWKISSLSCANRSIFLAAEGSCVSWGSSPTYGELGYGEGRAKSSTTPDEVKTLEGVHVLRVACGYGHTLLMARDKRTSDQNGLSKLTLWP